MRSTGEGDECYRVIEREPPKEALCLPMMGKHVAELEPVRGEFGSRAGGKKRLRLTPS